LVYYPFKLVPKDELCLNKIRVCLTFSM